MTSLELTNAFISADIPTTINTQPTKKRREKKEIPTCQICVEPFNKSTRLLVQCPFCAYECCRSCCETYILNESTVKCMNPECAKQWSRKHIREKFTLVFINSRLKQHTEKILFDKERALLPATQPIVESKLEAAKIQVEIDTVYQHLTEYRLVLNDLTIKKHRVLNRKPRAEARAFVRACPDEDCRGFLSTQWKCGICDKWTCPDCHIVKGFARDAEHTCNEDDLATARLLASDTKPCPKCGTGIFKIDGCDQMWCTQCHTPFSWRTGHIEKNVHNPHYFEWMRRNGGLARNPLDVPCGRNLDHQLCESFSRMIRGQFHTAINGRDVLSRLNRVIRNAIHINAVERPRQPDYERRNEDLRIAYLMKEITEEDMRDLLQRDDKRFHRKQELADVYTLLTNTVTDILYRFLDQLRIISENPDSERNSIDDSILAEIDTIVTYVNECLGDIAHTYSCGKVTLDGNLTIDRRRTGRPLEPI